MNFLENVKKRILITDDKQDDQLKVIIDNVKKELLAMLPTIEDNVPEESFENDSEFVYQH